MLTRNGSLVSYQVRMRLVKAFIYAIVILGVLFIMLPFVWMLSTALKPLGEVFLFPPKWIPTPPKWHNFAAGWRSLPFTLYLGNTLTISVLAVLGQVLSGSLVAFGFARLRAPGRKILFLLLLSTMMLPPQVTMIPKFILFRYLGWLDTFNPLIVPAFFGGIPFYIFLMRQFYLGIPREIDDAARIDGCSTFGIFRRLILPQSKPVLAAVGIFTFLHHWEDFLEPLIYLNSETKYTLSLGLNILRDATDSGYTVWNELMAVSLLVMIPPVLIFFFAQKYFIQGIVVSGLKG